MDQTSPKESLPSIGPGVTRAAGRTAAGTAYALWRSTRRLFILIIGVTVILIGVALLVTPGPAMLVIPAGLAILATEFVWARKLLINIKASVSSAASAVRGKDQQVFEKDMSLWQKIKSRIRMSCRNAVAPFRANYVKPQASIKQLTDSSK